MKKKLRAFLAMGALAALVVGSVPAQAASTSAASEPKKNISILSITYNGTPIAENEPALLQLQDLTNYNVKLEWILNSSYEDQLNTRMAAGNLPALVVITGKTPSVISNARAGAFWDITDEYKKYPNLAEANEIVMNNISIDGKVYGIYRARALGRNGISYRKDWADALGFEEINTLDDMYEFMKAVKENDPDGNGKADTYGVTWSKYFGPLDQLAVAFGAPNKWGVVDDEIIPWFDTQEYIDSMDYAKKLYSEGLVNKDFAALETSDWVKDFRANKTALHMDVSDEANRSQVDITKNYGTEDNIWVMTMPEGPNGRYVLPTTGNSGFVAITKNGVKNEAALADALNFLDLCNTKQVQNLLNYGVEGVHYDLTLNGEVKVRVFDQDPKEGFNQFMMNVSDKLMTVEQTAIQKQNTKVQANNVQYVVPNPCEPLTSDTYTSKGAQLDQMVNDARVQYIVGQIDEAGFKKVVDQWYSQGGKDICKEYTEIYNASK